MKVCLHCKSKFESDGWKCPGCSFEPEFENGFLLFAPELNNTDEGFSTEGFERLYALEEGNFWFRVRNQLIAWGIKKYFPSVESFLEIGCGTGFVLADTELRFPKMNCSGSELHTAGLEFAKSRVGSAPLIQMDARNIPFQSEFDLIGAFDVLEHIKEDSEVLAQMYGATRPGGGIILTVPQHPFLWSSADELACHERRYTAKELKLKVSKAGFTVARTTSFVSLLLPFMAASRLKERLSKSQPDQGAELKLPAALNSFFEVVLKFEASVIRAGGSFPAGGSLLLAAHKPE